MEYVCTKITNHPVPIEKNISTEIENKINLKLKGQINKKPLLNILDHIDNWLYNETS